MPTEIERKFLVSGPIPDGEESLLIQGYLNLDPERTVRVRIDGDAARITIKGAPVGIMRPEFEYPIPTDDARSLLKMIDGAVIEKIRRRVQVGAHLWEVDVFHGANEGLVVAEVELASEDEEIELPDWVGEEVTDDPRYVNSRLVLAPFCDW